MNRAGAPGKLVDRREQERRLKKWCDEYLAAVGAWRDDEGQPSLHTYFNPAEEYDGALIDRLAEHCHAGWGEIEIYLHHGVEAQDTKENTLRALVEFRDALAAHAALPNRMEPARRATPSYKGIGPSHIRTMDGFGASTKKCRF